MGITISGRSCLAHKLPGPGGCRKEGGIRTEANALTGWKAVPSQGFPCSCKHQVRHIAQAAWQSLQRAEAAGLPCRTPLTWAHLLSRNWNCLWLKLLMPSDWTLPLLQHWLAPSSALLSAADVLYIKNAILIHLQNDCKYCYFSFLFFLFDSSISKQSFQIRSSCSNENQ